MLGMFLVSEQPFASCDGPGYVESVDRSGTVVGIVKS
jgi:hypothetical protein